MEIISYNSQYAKDFKKLNIEWLETYFYVEPYDLAVLSDPEHYIIHKGGFIFFAKEDNKILGTVALMPTSQEDIFELTKMAVLPESRGRGIGKHLMEHCISFARTHEKPSLILYSNTVLENAIHIYKKYGFKEIPVEANASYERANIKMELVF
ncbi:GNAT family N-acetyltransferase [Dokdonia sp. Hel_I_53]|uniref:GNAT family N-acetyltransferase n=1 Tax=Dokdonia sp. Hel_I_53 TaxID=1566287 RepID=UPI00119F8F93|nr:GNAT family N-acetyltransferase [Dokdonia sp. Hel_I_53]